MAPVAQSIAGVLLRYSDGDGVIPADRADIVLRQAGELVQAVFVTDGRTSLAADGRPLSPFARILMGEVALVTQGVVQAHAKYMEKHLDLATRQMLLQHGRQIQELVGQRVGYPAGEHFQIFEQDDKLSDEEWERLRLFAPNPLAEYEPAHTWVDPNGYVLSQRIWNNSTRIRQKLDGLMSDLIRQGMGSREIARRVEQFLLPGRAAIRTKKPYGSDASYDAMRLARTEIARAHNNAAWVSAMLNPYVEQVRMRRSANGDITCPVCPRYAGAVGGEGIVYSVYSVIVAPYHPHCMCYMVPETADSPAAVTARLRQALIQSEERNLRPFMTPVQQEAFISMLMGWDTWQDLVRQLMPGQVRLF
jgi:hypothetical protein